MSRPEVQDKLDRLLSRLPLGSKEGFARECGYRGRYALHTLRGVAKGGAMLPDACRRRISCRLNEVRRGELTYRQTGTYRGRPTYEWYRPLPHDRKPAGALMVRSGNRDTGMLEITLLSRARSMT